MKKILWIIAVGALLWTPTQGLAQFAGVTNGPSSNTNCQSAPGVYFDVVNGVAAACGNGHTLQTMQTALGAFSAQTAVTSVTTAQNLATLALNANVQAVPGRTLRLCGYGIYTSPGTTTPTLTLQVAEGGVIPVAITSAGISATASTNMPFQFCFDLTTVTASATGTVEAHGSFAVNITANTPAAAVATYADTNVAVSSTFNMFAANTLALQVAASSTVTSVQLRQLTIELVN